MTKVLTSAAVTRLRPIKAGCREIPDGQSVGLYLLIFPSGKKSWALRYRRPGNRRPAKLTLGTVHDAAEIDAKPVIGGHLSLAGARRLVAELKHDIAIGRDPGQAYLDDKRKTVAPDSFGTAARDFVEQHAMKRTRRWQETARLLGLLPDGEPIPRGLADRWRDRPVGDIDDDSVFRLVEEVRTKGVPGLGSKGPSESRARSFHSVLSVMFGWLKDKRRIKVNPVALLSRPRAPEACDRVLADAEIAAFWKECDRIALHGKALRLLLLTGCRLREVTGMRRSELNGADWNIPGSRTKNGKPYVVPLPPLALAVVASTNTTGDIVFTTNGRTPVGGWSTMKKRLHAAMKIPAWRLHDLRRTCATGMAGIGIAPHVVEACLNHVSGAKAGVAGTYNRHAYGPEKKAALERWASHLNQLIEGRKKENVVPLKTA
jgi:integrase